MKPIVTLYRAGLFALALLTPMLTSASSSPRMIGANLSGGDFGSAMPGVLFQDYFYPSERHWDWAKGQGIELVRLPFRWERIQHDTNGVLDAGLWATDIAEIDKALNHAEARGIRVILDMHNYAGRKMTIDGTTKTYKIGTAELPTSEFARAWRLLAAHFKDRKSLWGYDIMNEPIGLSGGVDAWVPIAQAAVDAIREVDVKTAIILEGYYYANAHRWATEGEPLINVVDPGNNLIYSAHMYPDYDASGTWSNGGTVEAELVTSGKFATLEEALQVGVNRVKPFVDWCVANNVRGLLGEYGSHRLVDVDNWATILQNTLDYIVNNGNGLISATQWGGGPWTPTYKAGMGQRRDNSASPFMPMVQTYTGGPGSSFWYNFSVYKESFITTADYTYTFVYPVTTPATVTFNAADTSTFYSGSQSAALTYTVPSGGFGGAGVHIRGPLTVGGVGGIDISKSVAAGHVLSFYAQGTPGANPQITLVSTSDATGVDSGSETAAGQWISLGSIQPLTETWQRYEIPLSSFLNAQLTGDKRIQRLKFNALPADDQTYQANFDQMTIALPSTSTAPIVTVDTSTGASSFFVGENVTLVAAASDADPGDGVEYVEFYANETKVGIDGTAPYEWTTSFASGGTYNITALAMDLRGISAMSVAKTVTINDIAPPATPTDLTATPGDGEVILNWSASSGATSYNVKRATTSGGPYTIIASSSTNGYRNTGLINGTTYHYVVSAVNTYGESGDSTEASATPAVPIVPIIVDNSDSTGVVINGTWVESAISPGYYGSNYLHDEKTGTTISKSVRLTPTLPESGSYNVYLNWVAASNRATNVPIDVAHAGGLNTIVVNQRNSGDWFPLGTFSFNAGTAGSVTVRNDGANGYVIADAVKFVRQEAATPPAAPTGLTAAAISSTQIDLSWTASPDATNYNVKRATVSGGPHTTIASGVTGTTFSDGGLAGATTYHYVVSAVNAGGESPDSNEASATTLAAGSTPSAPTGLGAVGGDTQVSLSWTASADTTSYNVKRATVSGGPYTTVATGVTATSYTNTGLTNGTTYYFVVSAVNAYGESANSTQASATPTEPMTAIIVDNTDSEGVLISGTWVESTITSGYHGTNYLQDENSGLTISKSVRLTPTLPESGNYTVYLNWVAAPNRATNVPIDVAHAGGMDTIIVNQRNSGAWFLLGTFSFNAGTTGSVTVRNDSANGYVIADAVKFVRQEAATPPAAPTGLTAAAISSTQIDLSWTASPDATNYNVKRATVSGGPHTTIASGVTGTTFSDGGLASATTYYYMVSAVNAGGESPASNEASATTLAAGSAPSAPTGLGAVGGDTQVSLSWIASAEATSYSVKRATVSGGPYTTVASGITETNYTNTGLTNGTTYYFVVSAVNAYGESANSTQASATPQAAGMLAPTNLTATAGKGKITLGWLQSESANLKSNKVYRSSTSGGPYTLLASFNARTTYNDTVPTGTTYYYVVTAVNTAGVESGYSNEAGSTAK